MNKNLEIEYKNMICAEVPDIWDKIEAKIDAQEAENAQNVQNIIKAAGSVDVAQTAVLYSDQKNVVPFKKKTRWKYFVFPAAAALLCVAIAIPVLRNAGGSKTAEAPMASNSAADTAAVVTMDAAAELEEAYDSEQEYCAAADNSDETRGGAEQTATDSLTGNSSAEIYYGDNKDISGVQSYKNEYSFTTTETTEECEDDIDEETVLYEGVFTIVISEEVTAGDKKILAEEVAEEAGLVLAEDEGEAATEEGRFILKSMNALNESQIAEIIRKLGSYGYIKDVNFEESIR